MHWARLLLSLIFVSVVRSAVWVPLPVEIIALDRPTICPWTLFTPPDIELNLLGGNEPLPTLFGFFPLQATDPPTIGVGSSGNISKFYPDGVKDHTATLVGNPELMLTFGGEDANGNYLNTTVLVIRPSSTATQFGAPSKVTAAARAGHSAVVAPQGTVGCAQAGGCVIIFGGRNADSDLNEMLRVDPVLAAFSITVVPQTNTPAARYHHTAVVVNNKMYMMGGENRAGTIFDEVMIFDLTTSTWSAGEPMPTGLTGHAAVAMGTEIYVFGGRVSPSLLSNTLYIYDTTLNQWTVPSETENTPSPRVYPRVVPIDANRFLIYGGNDGTQNLRDLIVYDISKPCPYLCPFSKKCESEAACSTYIGCYNRTSDSALFKCRLDCITDPRNCVAQSCAQFTCWNGLCAETAADCEPYPRCPMTWRRCADGLCGADCAAFNATQLCSGVLCADGTCVNDASECIPFNGCAPGLIQCPSGQCAPVLADCYCNATTTLFTCASYTADCEFNCDTALWMKTVMTADLTVKIIKQDEGNLTAGSVSLYREGRAEILAALRFNLTNQANSATVSVAPVAESRFSIAQYPLWSSAEDYRRKIVSAVMEVSTDQPANLVTLGFAFNVADRLGKNERCLARLVESTVNGTTTALWKCVDTDFPQVLGDAYLGAQLDEYGVFALIVIKPDNTPIDTQQPFSVPTDYEPEAHKGIAITAGGLLLGLILVVTVRAIQQRA